MADHAAKLRSFEARLLLPNRLAARNGAGRGPESIPPVRVIQPLGPCFQALGAGEGGKNEDDEYFDLLPNI